MLEDYQNIGTNDPPGYNPDEWQFRRIRRNISFFKEKEEEEKWRHELKTNDNGKNWFQDK